MEIQGKVKTTAIMHTVSTLGTVVQVKSKSGEKIATI